MPDTILPEIYTVHPAAEAFAMLPDDRLRDMAASIAEDGQHFPIVFTTDAEGEPVLLDGRNRLAACGIAEVHPKIEWRDFDDDAHVRRFIFAASERRDITDSQRAMSYAVIFPKGIRGKKVTDNVSNLDSAMITRARRIVQYRPDLIDQVRDGTMSFNAAFTKADTLKKEQSLDADRQVRIREHLPELKEHSEELAEKMQRGEIEVDAALHQMAQDKEQARLNRTCQSRALARIRELYNGFYMDARNGDYVKLLTLHSKEFEKETSMTVEELRGYIPQLAELLSKFTIEE